MRVLRELMGMPMRENVMSLIDDSYEFNRLLYPELNIPERPINPSEGIETNLQVAIRNLRKSLENFEDSPFRKSFVEIFFDEISNAEADAIVKEVLQKGRLYNTGTTSSVMQEVRERALRAVAEANIEELGI